MRGSVAGLLPAVAPSRPPPPPPLCAGTSATMGCRAPPSARTEEYELPARGRQTTGAKRLPGPPHGRARRRCAAVRPPRSRCAHTRGARREWTAGGAGGSAPARHSSLQHDNDAGNRQAPPTSFQDLPEPNPPALWSSSSADVQSPLHTDLLRCCMSDRAHPAACTAAPVVLRERRCLACVTPGRLPLTRAPTPDAQHTNVQSKLVLLVGRIRGSPLAAPMAPAVHWTASEPRTTCIPLNFRSFGPHLAKVGERRCPLLNALGASHLGQPVPHFLRRMRASCSPPRRCPNAG